MKISKRDLAVIGAVKRYPHSTLAVIIGKANLALDANEIGNAALRLAVISRRLGDSHFAGVPDIGHDLAALVDALNALADKAAEAAK